MDPLSLGGLAITLAPTLARWLGGSPSAQEALAEVASVAREVAGTEDAESVRNAIAANPEQGAQLKIRLAEIAARLEEAERNADREDLLARLADVAGARRSSEAMAAAGSPLAYGAFIVSMAVLGLFGFTLIGTAYGLVVPDSMVKLLEYSLIAVLGYWVGSSAGSAAKDRRGREG
ncbi:hypothetical protein [Falsiroseomonas sp. CW058]|uniref:hypothetical protein n=1 Tax=Falsiroseomonas sp. CW058 TaxID=3388664 RepID=UPI003D31E1C0